MKLQYPTKNKAMIYFFKINNNTIYDYRKFILNHSLSILLSTSQETLFLPGVTKIIYNTRAHELPIKYSLSVPVDCPHPTCNGHGFCAEGICLCKKGWKGADCSETDNEALQCLPDCSGHGAFDLETQTCQCEPMWSGDDCSRGERRKHFIGTPLVPAAL